MKYIPLKDGGAEWHFREMMREIRNAIELHETRENEAYPVRGQNYHLVGVADHLKQLDSTAALEFGETVLDPHEVDNGL